MKTKTLLIDLLIITGVMTLLYGFYLGSYHLILPDEGRYVEVAREMLVSHNFIVPELDHTTFLDKPILYYWLEALFIHCFGLTEAVVRLVPLLFGIIGVALNYIAGSYLYNRRTGILSGLILGSSIFYFLAAHYADMDLMIAVLLSGSLWLFLLGIKRTKNDSKQWCLIYGAYVFAGLAFLTKGLMAIAFPAMVIGLWTLFLWRWKTIKKLHLITGILLFLAMVLPWVLLIQHQRSEFMYYFFVVQQFSRYVGQHFNMHQPFYYYLIVVLVGFFPWILFVPQALRWSVRMVRQVGRKAEAEWFLLIWFFGIFIFFSIPASKIPGYILPVFPPLAALVARYLDQVWEKLPDLSSCRTVAVIFLMLAILVSISFIVLSYHPEIYSSDSAKFLVFIALMLLCGGVYSVFSAFFKRDFWWVFVTILVTSLITYEIAIMSAKTFKFKTTKPVAVALAKQLKPNDAVVTYFTYYQDLPVYLKHPVYVVAEWNKPALRLHDGWRRELGEDIIFEHKRQHLLLLSNEFLKLWQSKRQVYVLTRPGRVVGLEHLVGRSTLHEMLKTHDVVLFSNKS